MTIARRVPRIVALVLAILLGIFAIFYIIGSAIGRLSPFGTTVYGATFSRGYAEYLGLDWKTVYAEMFDDLDLRLVRISAYWNEIEPEPGRFDFTDLDWQVEEAARRNVRIILVMGMKSPRWPECYLPDWTAGMSVDEIHDHLLGMFDVVVRRYKDTEAVAAWQVENEALLPFGMCPKPDYGFLKQEVARVHELDSRPIVMQEPGELSTWYRTSRLADTLGTSLYRVVWTHRFGRVHWPALVSAYWFRAALARTHVDRVIITELQAEPWLDKGVLEATIEEQLKYMDPDTLRNNVNFANLVGFPEIYFWGVEWWYWLKTQGHPEVWNAAREIIMTAHSQ